MNSDFLKKQKYKQSKKRIVVAILIIVALIFTALFVKKTWFDTKGTSKKAEASIEIRCDELSENKAALEDKALESYIPKDGIIIAKTKYKISEDETTVMDVLQKACKEKNIQIEEKKGYIKGINYLYEFSAGKNSGWMYTVNGKFPNYGARDVTLKNGDKIKWLYTIDYNKEDTDMK